MESRNPNLEVVNVLNLDRLDYVRRASRRAATRHTGV